MASAVAGIFSDHGGSPPSNLYVGLGESNATNSGVSGPTPTTPVPVVDGLWNGPSYFDWRLTSAIPNLWVAADSVRIINGTIKIFATFNDTLFDYGSGNVDIREIVVGIGNREPNADPIDMPSEKPYSILSRANFFTKIEDPPLSGTFYYADDPYVKTAGGNLTVRYQFRFG